jgi:NADH:ubiquinone oxidoreductase subunit 6 (subunit J)
MPAPDPLILGLLGLAAVLMAIAAVWLRNLIRAVVAYALASIFVAALFFQLDSPFAGALELTVGAGLVAVLFLVALILSHGEEVEVPS